MMKIDDLPLYKYNGARSLIILQEKHMRSFLLTWRKAKEINISLPETQDKDYMSLETLLCHVLRSSRGYILWICDKLNLPNPNIKESPNPEQVELDSENYLNYLLDKWRLPLRDVNEKLFYNKAYISNWGIEYCIDAMLEHAVMHPIRHEYQLLTLMKKTNNK